ncbi:MAG: hypothetical protein PHQ04_05790 [Opitutaceae bacterium]|nr:hypothetical protein [Opitutaceae bacterium]
MSPHTLTALLLTVALTAAVRLAAAEPEAAPSVVTPAMRQARIDAAKQMLAPKEMVPAAKLLDPFHPAGFVEAAAAAGISRAPADLAPATEGAADTPPVAAGPRTERDILMAIAKNLKPKAVFMGSRAYLFFGEKKTTAGDSLTLTYEGVVYQLQITAIDRTTFTLRLNREEYTRPIK